MGSIFAYLFSPAGRFRRSDYWLHALVDAVIWIVVLGIGGYYFADVLANFHPPAPGSNEKMPPLPQGMIGMMIGLFVFALVMMVSGISSTVRRFHDFGKSGWNTLWFIVPLVNIYFAFKLAFFRGDAGDNAYGPSPYVPQPPKPPKPPRDVAL